MSIDFNKILNFLGENANKDYQKIDRIKDVDKRMKVEKMRNDASEMLEEWKKLYPYFRSKGYTYNSKTASQWLDGSNTKVKSYLWLPLKKIGKEEFNTSISIFAELTTEALRFRVSIEIDDKKSNRMEYSNHNRYLDYIDVEKENFDYFGSKNNGLKIEIVQKDEVIDFINKVKIREYNKIQVGKYFTKNYIESITSDEFLNELDSIVNKLEKYYDIAVGEVNNIESTELINEDKTINKSESNENSLLNNITEITKQIQKYINSKGFVYNPKDLNNFTLSLKTKPFVILAGISGTGKSKLVKLFANAIGATSENGQYNIISVKPDWNDSTELFGYKNINDEFVPGKLTGIIKTASSPDNINKPYFICLDEMNLARVEYYLSEYLSIIESREFKNGEIVTDELFSNGYLPSESKYCGLKIPENIYIIGTVNMDDTTFAFSRKVLDRANTIEFSDVDLNLDILDFGQEDCNPIEEVTNDFLKTTFINIKQALINDKEFVKEINDKIKAINEILKKGNKNFGYRVRDEIVFYMLENKIAELLDEDTAFDYQIMQKILPTISGSEPYIKEILIKLFNYCITDGVITGTGEYIKACEKIVSAKEEKNKNDNEVEGKVKVKYKKSIEKILMMLRGYEDGFTSFWV